MASCAFGERHPGLPDRFSPDRSDSSVNPAWVICNTPSTGIQHQAVTRMLAAVALRVPKVPDAESARLREAPLPLPEVACICW